MENDYFNVFEDSIFAKTRRSLQNDRCGVLRLTYFSSVTDTSDFGHSLVFASCSYYTTTGFRALRANSLQEASLGHVEDKEIRKT